MENQPLLNNSEGKKRIILYIIMGILLIAVIVLVVLLGTKKCNCENKCPECPKDDPHYDESHFVPIRGRVYSNKTEGSAALQGGINHFDSKYLK